MTPTRLAEIMRVKRWTRVHLAGLLGCQKVIIAHWINGERDGYSATVAPVVADWLEAVMAGEDQPPPAPETWKRHRGGSRRCR